VIGGRLNRCFSEIDGETFIFSSKKSSRGNFLKFYLLKHKTKISFQAIYFTLGFRSTIEKNVCAVEEKKVAENGDTCHDKCLLL
jgi:hypothetical protein